MSTVRTMPSGGVLPRPPLKSRVEMDEMGTLALYAMIGENQKDANQPVTVGKVKMMDKANRKEKASSSGRKFSKECG